MSGAGHGGGLLMTDLWLEGLLILQKGVQHILHHLLLCSRINHFCGVLLLLALSIRTHSLSVRYWQHWKKQRFVMNVSFVAAVPYCRTNTLYKT